MLGEILVAEGLVTPADVELALKYQNTHGGRLGDCVVGLRLMSAQQIEEVLKRTPQAPSTLKEVGVDPTLLLQLMVKGIHVENLEMPSQIAKSMQLRSSIVRELLQEAGDRKLAVVVGQANSGGNAFSELRYELTQSGHDWAVESLAQSRYVGPAPVSLAAFQDRVMRQSIANEAPTRSDLQNAFRELVVPDHLVDRLGPSINSGSAILMYGPSGNGKTTMADALGRIFGGVIYIPYCFEVDGHIIKVFDPSVHKAVTRATGFGDGSVSMRWEGQDQRWVRCTRPVVVTGGELTLDMLDLTFSERSRFYEAPLHLKALNGTFVIDDLGRQRAAPGDILNRWILPLHEGVDYLTLHTGKTFQVPFDELVIFSTNMHPNDLMDDAFLRRLDYKIEAAPPTEPLFRRVFEKVCRKAGLEFEESIYDLVLAEFRARDARLAFYQPDFIVRQVLASCKFLGTSPRFTHDNIHDAILNLFVSDENSATPD